MERLTSIQFSMVFLEKYMPYSFRDCLRDQFSRLDQGSMIVLEYESLFYVLVRYATSILSTSLKELDVLFRD